MQLRTLLPTPHLLQLDYLTASDVMITLVGHTGQPKATCPRCGRPATRVQSRYTRTVADLPWHGIPVRLQLRLRRFFCDQPDCATAIFTERLPGLVSHYLLASQQKSGRSQIICQVTAKTVGADGFFLLKAIYAAGAPAWLREVPAVQLLRQVWIQQFYRNETGIRWRSNDEIPPAAQFIGSPHDPEAHYGKKGSTAWIGYKVHFTETCEPDAPHLIIDVQTTPATTADGDMTPTIHAALQAKALLPQRHLVDTGYLDAPLLVSSQEQYQVDLVGPTRANYQWQAKADTGFALADFTVDWEARCAICPEGKKSVKWNPAIDRRDNAVIKIGFADRDCQACRSRDRCTSSKRARRMLTVRPQAQYEALQRARAREQTPEFAREYAGRAGIEGTLSQGIRVCALRRSRYGGQAKTHLQHLLTAAALNLLRVAQWLLETPRATTRVSAFARLLAAPT